MDDNNLIVSINDGFNPHKIDINDGWQNKSSETDFLDFIDYSKIETIEALYKYYNTIYKYAEKGNTAWASVLADLDKAIEHANLNDKQKQCIEQYLINNNKIEDVAHHMNLVKSTIFVHTHNACKKISKFLTTYYNNTDMLDAWEVMEELRSEE